MTEASCISMPLFIFSCGAVKGEGPVYDEAIS